jgi:glutaredoxin 3
MPGIVSDHYSFGGDQVKHRIEVFSAGCDICRQTIDLVSKLAGADNDVAVHDMQKADNATRAYEYGVRSVPAVVIDGKLAGCCTRSGPDEQVLREALR